MAEETNTEQPAKKAEKAPRRSKGKAGAKKAGAKKAGAKAGASATKQSAKPQLEALATEKPVPSVPQEETSKYIVTVDNQTGLTVKIEKLDDKTGKTKELSKEEYGHAMAYANLSSSPYGNMGDYDASASEIDTLMQAYYKGVADYINALTSE